MQKRRPRSSRRRSGGGRLSNEGLSPRRIRVGVIAAGLAAFVAIIGIIAGVPLLLVSYVGNPLPAAVPDPETVWWSLRNGLIPNRFWIGSLAVVVWFAWAQLTISVLLEVIAVVRTVEAPTLPSFGPARSIATQLVGAVLMLGLFASALPEEVGALGSSQLPATPPQEPVTQTVVVDTPSDEPSPELLRVEVARRQTLRSLAADHLGDPERWSEIRNHNIGSIMSDGSVLEPGFTRISPGWTLEIPGVASVVGEWETREGDHFWRIAAETLEAAYGRAPTEHETATYWREVVEHNADQVRSGNPDLIHPGEHFEITLPPLPTVPVTEAAPITTEPFSLNGLLPENVFDPAKDLLPRERVIDVASGETVGKNGLGSVAAETTPVAPPANVDPAHVDPAPVDPAAAGTLRATEPSVAPVPGLFAVPYREQVPAGVESASRSVDPTSTGLPNSGRVVAGVAGLGFLAFGFARAVRRRRELQWARRVEGRVPATPSSGATLMLADLNATSDASRSRDLDQFLRCLLADAPTSTAARITHVEIGDHQIVVHIDGDVGDLAPCSFGTVTSERVISRSDARAFVQEASTTADALPLLVEVGRDPQTGRDLLINLGHALGVDICGAPLSRRRFVEALAAELATTALADDVRVICCGFGKQLDDLKRVQLADTVRSAVDHLRADPFRSIDATRTVLLVADQVSDDDLGDLAALTLTGIVVVACGLQTRWSVEVAPGAATVRPIDRELCREELSDEQVAVLGELIETSALSEYVLPDSGEVPASDTPTSSIDDALVDINEVEATDAPPDSAPDDVAEPMTGVMLDCDIEVRVLGRVEVVGAERDFESARALDVISYLAFHRDGADADQLRTWIWPVDEPPTDKAFANVLSRARKGLGVDDDGKPYLSRAGRDGVYRLSKAVSTDFDRFMAHIEGARVLDGDAALEEQVEALRLLRGVPFTGGGATGFIWTDLGTRSHVDFTIDETAHACADRALALGETATAKWAALKGLSVIPGCEQCYRRRLQAAAADGNRNELVAAMRELERQLGIEAGEPEASDMVSPDLVELYEDLLGSLGRSTVDLTTGDSPRAAAG